VVFLLWFNSLGVRLVGWVAFGVAVAAGLLCALVGNWLLVRSLR
jgi:hypothetical protein